MASNLEDIKNEQVDLVSYNSSFLVIFRNIFVKCRLVEWIE